MLQQNCFVLDLDDTLYPERDYVRSGFRAVDALVADRLRLAGFGDACWQLFLRGDRGRIFDAVLQSQYGLVDPQFVSELVHTYRVHKPSIELHPDAQRFLARAQRLGLPLALITDGPQGSQRAKISALALEDTFSPIVVTAELGEGKSKPHVAAFELVENALGVHGCCCYIADNPHKDFLAPNQLGWKSVRIERPGGIYSQATEPTPAHAPHYRITSLDDVWDLHK